MMLEPLTGWTLQSLLGLVFRPLAWLMGIPGEHLATVGSSLGLDGRSWLILTYALCGFSNLGSVGIMLGGLTTMCPERRADIVRLDLPALVAANIACCMTGAVVGLLTAP